MINAIQCLKKPLLSLSCFFSCIWQSHRCEYSINKMNHLLTFNYFLLMIFKQTNQKVLSDNYCCQACQCQVPFTYWQEDLLWQPGYFSSEVAWNYSVLYSVNKTKSALIRIGSDLYDLYGFTHCLKSQNSFLFWPEKHVFNKNKQVSVTCWKIFLIDCLHFEDIS